MTLDELADDYFRRAGPRLAPVTLAEARRIFTKDVSPRLGRSELSAITTSDLVSFIDAIAPRGDKIAKVSFSLVRTLFSHGVARRLAAANPCSDVSLAHVLGRQRPARLPALNERDIPNLLLRASELGHAHALAVRILLVTGAKRNELRLAKWVHLDFDSREWVIPTSNTQNRRPHVFPLPHQAVDWFLALRQLARDSPWILPGRTPDQPCCINTLNAALKTIGITPSHLRRTARTILGHMGVSFPVAETYINHSLGYPVEASDRGNYMGQRRVAADLLATLLCRCGA